MNGAVFAATTDHATTKTRPMEEKAAENIEAQAVISSKRRQRGALRQRHYVPQLSIAWIAVFALHLLFSAFRQANSPGQASVNGNMTCSASAVAQVAESLPEFLHTYISCGALVSAAALLLGVYWLCILGVVLSLIWPQGRRIVLIALTLFTWSLAAQDKDLVTRLLVILPEAVIAVITLSMIFDVLRGRMEKH